MTSDNANHRLVVVAAVAASFLMLIFGFTHRAMLTRLVVFENRTPIDPAALERLPVQIGDWTGQDVPVDEAIVDVLGTDAHIYRRYSRSSDSEFVSLYVACGVNAFRALGHRPEVCHVAAGWTLMDHRSMELPLNDGMKLPCSVFQFSRGGFDTGIRTVLCFYIVEGQYCGDVSLLQSKVWRGSGTVHYAAQVQIIASTEGLTDDSATKLVSAFAIDSASLIAQLVETLEKDRNSGEFH